MHAYTSRAATTHPPCRALFSCNALPCSTFQLRLTVRLSRATSAAYICAAALHTAPAWLVMGGESWPTSMELTPTTTVPLLPVAWTAPLEADMWCTLPLLEMTVVVVEWWGAPGRLMACVWCLRAWDPMRGTPEAFRVGVGVESVTMFGWMRDGEGRMGATPFFEWA